MIWFLMVDNRILACEKFESGGISYFGSKDDMFWRYVPNREARH